MLDRTLDAVWIRMIDLRIDASNPSIPNAHYRTGTELRLATSEEAWLGRQHRLASTYGNWIEQHGLGRRQDTEWKRVGAAEPPGVADRGGSGPLE